MATLVTAFKKYVAPDVIPCPDPIVDREIISAIIEFCDKTHILVREFTVTLDTGSIDATLLDSIDIDISEYGTDNKPITVLEFNLDGTPKFAKFRPVVNDIPTNIWNNIKEDETIYFDFPENTVLRVFDMTTSYTYLFARLAVKPTRSATQVDDFLLEDWVDTIAAGARYKLLNMPGKEWSDPKAAAANYIEWRRGISRARMKVMKSYTNRSLELAPKSFGQISWD